ncbi:integral membrane protein [Colletotrichum incanum]|uniref:Integral membrane protein n=1 Tax=Colletotrichum incanum TaxID=1573173 RepID=A0A166NEM3_COLIC|nr:integral membrane protein [Colletotrichum incanum]
MDKFPPGYANACNAGRIVGVVGVFHFIAVTFVSLRIYTRLVIPRAFGADDALIILAIALAPVAWICLVLQIPHGLGRHDLKVSTKDRMDFERIAFWKTVLSDGVAMGLLRISMATSLLRLNRDLNWYRWSLYTVIGFVVAYSIQAIIWLFVYRTPYSGWWEFQWMNPFDPRCYNFTIFFNLTYWNIACNILTDICLGALPIPVIWTLKMKLRVRLYVIGIFNLGYFAVIMGILKAVFILTTGGDPDNIFNYWVHFCQNLQLNIGIIAACASFLKPLLECLFKIKSSVASDTRDLDYNRSNQTPFGAGASRGNAYPASRKKKISLERSLYDELELCTKHDLCVGERQTVSPIGGPEPQLRRRRPRCVERGGEQLAGLLQNSTRRK